MLTAEQSIIDYRDGEAFPDRLSRRKHSAYVRYAELMIAEYRNGNGRTRRDLHRSVEAVLSTEPDCPARRVHAFCKLLDDAGDFDTDSRGAAAELRLRVFAGAAALHPLVREKSGLFGHLESEVKSGIAVELGRPWEEIEGSLYSDAPAFQKIRRFRFEGEAEDLLARYNVAQVQACLYGAENMVIAARRDIKRIIRLLKLAGLMFEICRQKIGGYRVSISGPASMLKETRRYGVRFAKMIPSLLACEDWDMQAILKTPWLTRAVFKLRSDEGIGGRLVPPEPFDSEVEEKFAEKFGEKRDGWSLYREDVVLHEGQITFVPDFVFRHDDGTEVLFEIVGFWTPEYLEKKRATLRRFKNSNIVLAVPEATMVRGRPLPENVVAFKTALKIEPVLGVLEIVHRRMAGA